MTLALAALAGAAALGVVLVLWTLCAIASIADDELEAELKRRHRH